VYEFNVVYCMLFALSTCLRLATMDYHFFQGCLELISSLLQFGSVHALCLYLVLVMVGKCHALFIPYGGLWSFADSLCFVGVVPLLVLCGNSLLWFLESLKSFSTHKSICFYHLAQASFLLYLW